MNFDMNTVWSRGIDLLRDNFSLLVVIAGIFLLLPTVALYLFIPDFQTFADPTADPEIVADKMGEILGPLLTGGLLATIVQFAGYGAMLALMGRDRPTVGQAIGTGFKIVPSTIAVFIIFMLAYIAGAVMIILPVTLIAGAVGSAALGIIGIIPVLVFVVWLMTRMSMSMPAMVLGKTLNPFTAVANSFRLTKAKQWAILLFWVVLVVAFTIISLLFNGVFGVVAALAASGTTQLLILGLANGVTSVVSGMLICALSVAMYDQLARPAEDDIEQVFD